MIRALAERSGRVRRGQPLIVLVSVLVGWVVMRVAIASVAAEQTVGDAAAQSAIGARIERSVTGLDGRDMQAAAAFRAGRGALAGGPVPLRAAPIAAPDRLIARRAGPLVTARLPWRLSPAPSETAAEPPVFLEPARTPSSGQMAAGNPLAAPDDMAQASALPGPRRARWSGDGWVLLRPSGGPPALATLPAAYGASQFGAVIRYDLRPDSAVRSQIYLRATGAIGAAFRDRQAALGAAIRPFPQVPLVGLIEGRLQQGSDTVRLRPAAALVSELAPFRLPLGAVGEVYGQAGWVGGRDATAFFDAQATAERTVLGIGPGTALGIGAGLWSGGQRGAARLDLGPHVVLHSRLGPLPVRAALDWRARVAGSASPGSGPVVTLSAGF